MEKQNLLSKYNRIKFTPSKYASLLDELFGVLDFEEIGCRSTVVASQGDPIPWIKINGIGVTFQTFN